MHFHLPLLLFLLVTVVPSDAGLLAQGSDSLVHAAHFAHRRAIKRSTGLAQDLRRAFAGILLDQPSSSGTTGRVYCVSVSGLSSNNTSSTGSGSNGTATSVSSGSAASASGTSSSGSSGGSSSPWKLIQSYQGSNFFDGWDFFADADPTHGTVQYVDQGTAQSSNLTEINGQGHAIMRVETTPQVSGNRMSVRITTTATYTGGLVILDAVHMPTGCATWPAFWSNGPNWPAGGEIDIVEGVNDYSNNQATIHTNPGCTIPSSNSSALNITGTVVGGTNCAAAETGNAGCGITATQSNTYGVGFNSNGGGVYAMQWVNSGISVFFFPRSSIPSDITAGAPQPSNWDQPMAFWPATDCNPFQFFNSHSAIFDTTLCGDWAGSVWDSAGAAGQAQSCAQRTGVSTCEAFVAGNGTAFADAYWEVSYVKIFQSS
ncbi:putative glycosidase C21B10.07 [Grifola frondosa]|uniref:Putative glycosidase C21B10.07 n=1 Tax=Grifola frondosa TaxID=5627 RepID=A0A1C7MQJ6_GRIFR|nr:putative glycosidase C21B10.07 [Grifola frondosa]